MIPGSANALLLATAAGGGGAYEVPRSVRFNSTDSAYLSRTPGSAGSGTTWSLSFWVKKTGNDNFLFAAGSASSDRFNSGFNSSDKFFASVIDGNSTVFSITTDAVFRDPSAWYHFLLVADTTNGTQANRFKIYVNGVQQTVSGTLMPSSQNTKLNGAVIHTIGVRSYTAADYFNGYLADVHLIDGQALDPSSFGEFDTNNVWQPKAYAGSYGTNGFRLDFADNSSAAALGYDAAGSNDWTVNNLSVTAGSGNDSLRDSPTNGSQTDTGVGGEVVGNYCTWNPIAGSTGVVSNGNLDTSNAGTYRIYGTFGLASGTWYWEHTIASIGSGAVIGISNNASQAASDANRQGYYSADGRFYNDSGDSAYGNTYTTGDVIGIAYDAGTGKLHFSKNGTWQNSGNPASGTNPAVSGLTGTYWPFATIVGCTLNSNYGQRPFAYTAPSGFKALCTTNLPAPTIANGATVMDVKLYTGNGSTQTVSGLGFSPDLVWIKRRSVNSDHNLFDIVRGATNVIKSNNTDAEVTASTSLTAFNSDGFSVGSNSDVNGNTHPIVAWAWDAGTSNATNTSGSITSTVRANISAGFSVVTWTGTGSNATVGHGLGVQPNLTIIKARTNSSEYWFVWHKSLAANYQLALNTTGAAVDGGTSRFTSAPSSSLLNLGTDAQVNANGTTYVAYCFAPVAGYSAFGSYVGNGSADGPFVFCNFRPAFIMVKRTDSSANWVIWDNKRDGYNTNNDQLYPNLSNAEDDGAFLFCDQLSNGFRVLNTSAERNASGGTYAYVAFAEHSFQYARAR